MLKNMPQGMQTMSDIEFLILRTLFVQHLSSLFLSLPPSMFCFKIEFLVRDRTPHNWCRADAENNPASAYRGVEGVKLSS